MRILVCHPAPHFSVHDVYVGWVGALRAAGQTVLTYPFGDALTFYDSAMLEIEPGKFRKALSADQATNLATDRLAATLYKARPEVLIVVSGFFLPYELLDAARWYGTKIVVLHTESPYEDDRQVELAQHADLNILNDPTNIDRFPVGTTYIPHAYRPEIHRPGPAEPDLACDVVFVGTGYGSRIAFLEAMDLTGLDVTLAGNWQLLEEESPLRRYVAHEPAECLDNADAVRLYRSARASLNLYRTEASAPELSQGWAMGPREVEMAACGLFFVRDPRPEGDELLPMLPTFGTPGEASELLRWHLAHDDVREDLAGKAREAVADRTFENHAARLLRLLEKE